jgi:hypothetical protein
MLVPVAAIVVVGELTGYAYRPWLITAGYPAMSLGMQPAPLPQSCIAWRSNTSWQPVQRKRSDRLRADSVR